MPCGTVWVTSFVPGVPSGFEYICWPDGELDGVNEPPDTGGGGSGGSSGVSAPISGPQFDAGDGDGTVIVAGDDDAAAGDGLTINPNPGWNGGAHSVDSVAADWQGMISFDVPDVQGARQGGVAAGLALVSELPTVGRSGYGHLRYGVVFTTETVKILQAGAVALEVPYADVRAAREVGVTTDLVSVLLYGAFVKWIINGLTLFAGPFSMSGPYALDATLYLAFDAVDNPLFTAGDWGDIEDGSLNGVLPAYQMEADASPGSSLSIQLTAFAMQMSEDVVWNLFAPLPSYQMLAGDSEGLMASLGAYTMLAADVANYSALTGSLSAYSMAMGMEQPDGEIDYSVLMASLPRLEMTMTFPTTARLDASLPAFVMRASSEASYSELVAALPAMRMVAYGGDLTPFIQIVESVGARLPVYQSVYVSIVLIERINGDVEAVGYATTTAEALENIGMADPMSYTATILDQAMELIGAGERVLVFTKRTSTGALVEDGEAWVVNTRTQASSRYSQYGFNSFAMVRGRHFGARATGLFLLEGKDDDGEAITSGVNLGKHNFGTQQEKTVRAVYAGVSTLGRLFLKISDGRREFTYKAIRAESRMNTQRFDPGRGLQSNYFNFVLISEGDSFELDTVEFDVLASQRRI